jgi:hypothetical protein
MNLRHRYFMEAEDWVDKGTMLIRITLCVSTSIPQSTKDGQIFTGAYTFITTENEYKYKMTNFWRGYRVGKQQLKEDLTLQMRCFLRAVDVEKEDR